MRHVPFAAALPLVALAGCATYSELDGNRYHRTAMDTYPVAIVRVDGESHLGNPVRVEPGRHEITVQAAPAGAHRVGDQERFTLDVKPCTRYWIVAVKEGPLASRFRPKVDYEEALAGCRPPR